MRYYFIIFLWIPLCSPTTILKKVYVKKQLIYSKKGSPIKTDKLIDTSANNFKDFVRQSDVFVDKSLLVNLVAQNVSFISLTFPTKWGKSINLDMLKTFLEIEVDENGDVRPLKESWSYKYFKNGEVTYENGTSIELNHPPRIAKNEYRVRSYLGQYPVIYLNLGDLIPESCDFEGFSKSFQERIAATFEAYKYVVETSHSELNTSWAGSSKKQSMKMLLEKFNQYRTHQVHSEKGMITSLEFLSSVLKSYFNKTVYILIDDYDAPIRKLCLEKPVRGDEAKKIIHFFRQFMTCTFETNNNNLRMGIVTGVMDLNVFANHSRSFSYVNYNLLNHNTWPSFGFKRIEVDELLACYHMDLNTTENTAAYYSRYSIPDSLKSGVYDPWSIVNSANERNISNFRSVGNEFKETEFNVKLSIIAILVNNTSQEGFKNLTFSNKDLILLNNIANGITTTTEYNEIYALIFKYHYAYAYVYDTNMINNLLSDMILEFQRTGIPDTVGRELNFVNDVLEKAKRVAEIIFLYFQHEGYRQYVRYVGIANEIENLHMECFGRSVAHPQLKNFYYFHGFVSQFMKIMFHYDGGLNRRYNEYGAELKPYLVFRRHDHRAIIEFECHNSYFYLGDPEYATRETLNRAKRFNVIFKNEPPMRTTFVGIWLHTGSWERMWVQIDTNPQYD